MTRILLLSDILERAFEPGEHCLFGKRNFVTIPRLGKHDFYFHSLDGVSPENLKPSEFARIPILNYEYPMQEDKSKIQMAELYRGKGFDTFALRDGSNRIAETSSDRESVTGNFLRFYSARRDDAGIEISNIDDYTITTKELMGRFIPNWENVKLYLNLEKERIEREQKR